MNAIDYFFENSYKLEKPFLVGKEEISYRDLYSSYNHLSKWINGLVGSDKHIMLLSANNLFFIKIYLAIIKSGNICIPLDPGIEKENYRYIHDLTDPKLIFLTPEVEKRLELNSDKAWYPDALPSRMKRTRKRYREMNLTVRSVRRSFSLQVLPGNPREL